jgi:hypothetical protein
VGIPALLWLLYYRLMFPGLTNPEALDYAQLGRNLASGRGFVTYLLRPLALVHGNDPLRQPEVAHGPLYPFLLALTFGALGVRESVVPGVSGFFYLLTIPLIYAFGRQLFSRAVGLAGALLFTANALVLEYAVSGLPITLYVFLATSLLFDIYRLAARLPVDAGAGCPQLPRAWLVLAGLLAAALYLTDPIFCWVIPVIAAAIVWLSGTRRTAAACWFLLPLGILVLPWMGRNLALAGNPFFGLRGEELWMHTKDFYPGNAAYRLAPDELVNGPGLWGAVLAKVALGGGKVVQALPQIAGSWILAFFLPALLFRFSDPGANAARRVLVACFAAVFCGVLLFGREMPPFVAWLPAMLVFSVAFLYVLLHEAKAGRAVVGSVMALAAVTILYPLAAQLGLDERPRPLPQKLAAMALRDTSRAGESCLSDQPWLVAWYADRPAVWLPANDNLLTDVRHRFAGTRWLFMAGDARTYSAEWQVLYDQLVQLNARYLDVPAEKRGGVHAVPLPTKGMPLLEKLDGFAWVPPAKNTPPTTVLAAVPAAGTGVGLAPAPEGRMARGAPAPGAPQAKYRALGPVLRGERPLEHSKQKGGD